MKSEIQAAVDAVILAFKGLSKADYAAALGDVIDQLQAHFDAVEEELEAEEEDDEEEDGDCY